MKSSLYEFNDYKTYLNKAVTEFGKGSRSKLAVAANCQPGYITHVLTAKAHFSPEQAEKVSQYLGHTEDQSHYFMTLVSYGRAGSETLRRYYRKQLDQMRDNQKILKNRMHYPKILSSEDQAQFYSSWHYGAFHVAVLLPGCNTEKGLSDYFDVPLSRVNEMVAFLVRVAVIARDGAKLKIGPSQIFIGSDSPFVAKLHTNWRLEAIKSLDRYSEKDLHYSSAFTASHKDVAQIREMMVKCIEDIRAVIKPSKDEDCFVYGLDLFKLGR